MASRTNHDDGGLKLHVLVIGAGLCGLSTALSVSLAGHQVTVLEAVSRIQEVGAGLQITPNGTRLLHAWGIAARLSDVAAAPKTFSMYRYTGKLLAHRNDYDAEIKERYGFPIWCLHRADLQKAMVDRALELGVSIRLNCRVANMDASASEVTLETGEKVQGDMIVGSDGLWSTARNLFFRQPILPEPTGDLAYRILLDSSEIRDADLRTWMKEPGIHIWVGPGVHAVAYSIKGGRWLNLVLLVPDNLPDEVSRARGNLEEMMKLFQGWDPILNRFLSHVKAVDKWRLMYLMPLDTWKSDDGRFVMAGDACHPMLPYMAQGANSSLEDGAILGSLIGKITRRDQVAGMMGLYDAIRRPRVNKLVAETFSQGTEHHLADGPEQEARDALLSRSFGQSEDATSTPNSWTHPKIQPWIFSYDAYATAEASLNSLN